MFFNYFLEASSWLLMATDLFPISTSSMGLSGNVFHDGIDSISN